MPTIQKTFRESTPALRFIGKKYFEVGGHWGEWFCNGWFDAIEAAMGGNDKITAIWENGGGYIGLERHKDGERWQYWLGMFVPADTPVPDGFEFVDFPTTAGLGTCWIYGKENEVHALCGSCKSAVLDNGMTIWKDADGAAWCFENCTCPRYTTPDENENIILDFCWFVE